MRTRLGRWGLGALAWVLAGAFFATQTFIGAAYGGRALSWGQALSVSLAAWCTRGAFAPAAFWLARRFSLTGPSRLRALAVHLAASLVLAVVQLLLYEQTLHAMVWVPARAMSPVELHTNLFVYWAVVALGHAQDYYSRFRDRELHAARLETQLSAARLDLLRTRLHPHFLFNTLHAISELMHEDVERADLMVTHLSELLRLALAGESQREVALRRELDFLRRYLEIEQLRFQDRLTVRIDAADGALDAAVPSLLLQPLAENAVRHGIATRVGPGLVEVRADRVDGRLRLTVRDDGPGLSRDGPTRDGVGLATTRERLRESFGSDHRFLLTDAAGGGLEVLVDIPFRVATAEAPRA